MTFCTLCAQKLRSQMAMTPLDNKSLEPLRPAPEISFGDHAVPWIDGLTLPIHPL